MSYIQSNANPVWVRSNANSSRNRQSRRPTFNDIKKENARLCRELDSAKSSAETAERHSQLTTHQLGDLRRIVSDLQHQNSELRGELDRQRAKWEAMEQLKKDVETLLRRSKEDLTKARAKIQEMGGVIAGKDNKISALRDENDKALAKLTGRTEVLHPAGRYLTKVDTLSDTDICSMLGKLNGEIFHCAASIAEAFEEDYMAGSCVRLEDREKFKQTVGARITKLFRATSQTFDPILVQIALQTVLVALVRDTVERWHMDGDGDESRGVLHLIYGNLKEQESQAVSAQWRMLARKHLRIMEETEPSVEPKVALKFANGIVNVLHMAGVRKVSHDKSLEYFSSHVQDIVRSALEMRKAIGEDKVASNFALLVHLDREIYNAEKMDDAYSDKDRHLSQLAGRTPSVLCTTQIGLERAEMRRDGEGGRWHRIRLLKPEVFLDTTLKELYQEENQESDEV